MDHLYNFPSLKKRRRRLRQQPIPSEAKMWSVLRNRQINGLKWRRQYSIDLYIVDFYCPKLRLVLEVDGDSHFLPGRPEHDAWRQRWLEEKGVRFIRFYSLDVIHDLDGVVESLTRFINQLPK